MTNRFQDMNPYEFEHFLASMFDDMGYTTIVTNSSGDFGVDFIAEKDNRRIAVQVKRYAKGNKVGVQDLNQVFGGKEYYNCDTSMLITTSSMTMSAWELANNIDRAWIWEWPDLEKRIRETYKDQFPSYFADDHIAIKFVKMVGKAIMVIISIAFAAAYKE